MICDSPNDHEDSNSVLLNFNSTNNNYNNHHHFLGMMVETVDLSFEF